MVRRRNLPENEEPGKKGGGSGAMSENKLLHELKCSLLGNNGEKAGGTGSLAFLSSCLIEESISTGRPT